MKETGKEKPGFMIYHRQLKAMKNLEAEQFKRLMVAFGEYSEGGELPAEMDGSDMVIFELYRERLDHDRERYEKRVSAARSGGIKKAELMRIRKGAAPGSAKACQSLPNAAEACQTMPSTPTSTPTPTSTTTPTPTSTSTTTPTTTPTEGYSSSLPGDDLSADCPQIVITSPQEEEEFPPTREMILSYLREKGWTDVDADEFISRCQETGWKDGSGEPVKNWRLWLKGYLIRQSVTAARQRTAPDPRIAALERLKQRYMTEEGDNE